MIQRSQAYAPVQPGVAARFDPPTVLHVGHHPQPGGGFADLVTRVEGREHSFARGDNVVGLLDSARACVDSARERLAARVEPVRGFGSGPVTLTDLPAALTRTAGVGHLRELCEENSVDVVHANEFRSGVVASVVSTVTGCPLLLHVHHTSSHRAHPWLRRWLFSAADRVVHVSKYTRDELTLGEPDHVVVRSPIDVAEFQNHPADPDTLAASYGLTGRPTVALIGRLAPNKGHERFIRAATEVDADFLIVGSGDDSYRLELESLVEELGVADQVTLTGFWENITDVYALSDVVVVPSTDENLPKVIQEALARRVPVVASSSGGIPELIEHERTGLLIEPGAEGTKIAAAVERLLKDDLLAERLAKSGLDRLRSEFDIDVVTERLEGVYDSVVHDESAAANR